MLTATCLSYGRLCDFLTFFPLKLINEFLAKFLLYLPYRKCCLNADLTDPSAASEAATDQVTLINGPSGRLMSACGQQSATRVVGVCACSRDKSIQYTELSRSRHCITLRCELFLYRSIVSCIICQGAYQLLGTVTTRHN